MTEFVWAVASISVGIFVGFYLFPFLYKKWLTYSIYRKLKKMRKEFENNEKIPEQVVDIMRRCEDNAYRCYKSVKL